MDVVSGNIELAIRVGWLHDPGPQALRIDTFRQLLVAPAAMKKQVGKLSVPEEITKLPFVANTVLRDHLRCSFSLNEIERQTVTMQASVFLDAILAVRTTVCEGASLSVLPAFAIIDDLVSGRLIHALPHWNLPSGGIPAVFPAARFRSAKLRAFVDLLSVRKQQRNKEADKGIR